jgi:HEAT repeat protein
MRGLAADTLGKIGGNSPEARDALVARLEGDDLATQRQALHGLQQLGPAARSEVPKLFAPLRSPDLQTQQAAGYALAGVLERDPTSVMPDLLAMLADAQPSARTGAAFALSLFGAAAAPAIAPLIELLDDPYSLPRVYAAVALGEIGPAAADALPRLQELQWDRDFRISGSARQALPKIRRRTPPAKRRR